ncbi:MAG: threonine--tRNA ligase [Candidatus Bathyarchaeia archaeon]|nr:threonine--tRNA ligase [Candidatus Bathyarchaeota archaeon]
MKMLVIHADHFEYEVTGKAVGDAEPLPEGSSKASLRDALVCFCTVEGGDGVDVGLVAERACREIRDLAGKLGVDTVVIYPYAHLSGDLADASVALQVLDGLANGLASSFRVVKGPFGWYKRFLIRCKGHPLAESFRSISAAEGGGAAAVLEEVPTEYRILTPDGGEYDPAEYEFPSGEEDFKALVLKEALKRETPGGTPRLLDYCRKFGIDWEPFSDVGHMRYGPEASIMFDLIGQYSMDLVRSLGIPVFYVRGSNMFNLAEPPVMEHAKLFGDRLYELAVDNRRLVLRYAACHQQFSIVKDWTISYRNIPFGTFEVADSYRLEKRGELLLCFRVRKLHMPDLHVYCRDVEHAKEQSELIHRRIYDEIRKLGREYVSIYNVTRSFYEENRGFILRLLKVERKPVLLNFVPEGRYYWVLNVEYTVIDEIGRPREIATFQIDVGNAQRFGITYVDEYGSRRHPVIIHTALIGSIERYLFTLLDKAALDEGRGAKPMLPLWVTPVQVRLIPTSQGYVDEALNICKRLMDSDIRADLDDRSLTVSRKVREAEILWIPYIVVLGEREREGGFLSVRRRTGEKLRMNLEELISEIKERCRGYPTLAFPLPIKLSERPIYK